MMFSIITPSRNQGRYIRHCLDSIYGQSYCAFEHLVMDGVSEDDTAVIVSNYPSTFVRQMDTGAAQAINRGLEMAKGDIVCWLNADDAFAGPDVLESVANIFRQHPEVDVITGDGYYIDDNGRLFRPIHPDRVSHMSFDGLRKADYFLQPATFWRRNGIRLDERLRYTFDWQLWLDFYAASLNIFYVPQYFALYRLHSDSLTQQDPPLRRKEIYDIVAKRGDSMIQRWWCWFAWRCHVLDQKFHTTVLRKGVRLLNSLLRWWTGGRINHG
jgi:glycosyltransferase involved in cell wall biosynthesis